MEEQKESATQNALEKEITALDQLKEIWGGLTVVQRLEEFLALSRSDAEDFFLSLSASEQHDLIQGFPNVQKRSWIRLLAPDDVADLIQQFPFEERAQILALLDIGTMKEVVALLAYAEDDAGGLMSPRFIRLRPDVSVDVAIRYLRAQAKSSVEPVHYVYVLDHEQKLVGVLSFRDLLLAPADKLIQEIMKKDLVTVPEDMDQEEVGRHFAESSLSALPVLDIEGKMKGVITVDDAVEAVEEEATEDIHKLGGTEALEEPYLQVSIWQMLKKRGIWLSVLFVGEMFTAQVMGVYEKEIERAVVLALFIPLIISSGGNSGSQATSLIIRSLALREIRQTDWWKVLRRELLVGSLLGLCLGLIGVARIVFWPWRQEVYGDHFLMIGITVAVSLLGVVLWGSVVGSMLPFMLRKVGADPATASAPLVATLVDVTGLVIYFSLASFILHGMLV